MRGTDRCVGYSEMKSLLNDTLKIDGVYSVEEQDMMKATQHRHSQQVEKGANSDIRELINSLFGESI